MFVPTFQNISSVGSLFLFSFFVYKCKSPSIHVGLWVGTARTGHFAGIGTLRLNIPIWFGMQMVQLRAITAGARDLKAEAAGV